MQLTDDDKSLNTGLSRDSDYVLKKHSLDADGSDE